MAELEIKFRLTLAALDHWRAALRAQGARSLTMRALYFDAPDGRLGQSAMSLRLRNEAGHWVQTLKAPGDSAIHRLESEVSVEAADGDVPTLDITRHDGTPAKAALDAALGDEGAAVLQPRHHTELDRLLLLVRTSDGSVLELALDDGSVGAGSLRAAVAELEIEHKDGPLEGLFVVAHDVLHAGGACLSSIGKSQRGDQLAGAAVQATKATQMVLARRSNSSALMTAALLNTLQQTLPNLSAIAEGQDGADFIHQARVGLRRMRTVLRELAPLAPTLSMSTDEPLSRAFGILGAHRDDLAVAATVRPWLEQAGSPSLAWTARDAVEPAAAVQAIDFQRALLQIMARAHRATPDGVSLSHAELLDLVASRLDQLRVQVLKGGRRFERLAVDRQHSVRKRLKRLRYLAELCSPLWPGKQVERFVDGLKPAQEALGLHNDTVVAAERFREEARSDPAAQFAAGFLLAKQESTARDAQRALKRVAKLAPFWKRPG